MKITDYTELIKAIPFRDQAFDIKKKNWEDESQQHLIDRLFDGNVITINRQDLYDSVNDLETFVLKTLMWGYPTKGRGKNIENILDQNNLDKLLRNLEGYRNNEISQAQLKKDIQELSGMGLSTMTKFTHFLNTKINEHHAVILDLQIIEAINTNRFEELEPLKGISYDNAINKYETYIKIISEISKELNAASDQVEMFLFTFGRNLLRTESRLQRKMNSSR